MGDFLVIFQDICMVHLTDLCINFLKYLYENRSSTDANLVLMLSKRCKVRTPYLIKSV